MTHMTYDWLTAAILEPILARGGVTLADLAGALHGALAGTYEPVVNKPTGRTLGVAEFKTVHAAPGGRFVELAMPGWDVFSSPSERRPFPTLPGMWGGVSREGDEYRLHPSAIALHRDLVALPSAGGGMMLFRAVLPDAVTGSLSGQPFATLVSHDAVDHIGLVARRVRFAERREMDHVEDYDAAIQSLLGPSAPAGAVWGGPAMVATFRNDKTARRVPFRP